MTDVCLNCGKTFTGRVRKGVRAKFCSTRCAGAQRAKTFRENAPEQICRTCQKPFRQLRSQARGVYCSHACRDARGWSGAITVNRRNGYAYRNVKGVPRAIHRLVMEEHLGRKLQRSEHIHHRDGDRLNNAIENLQIVTQKEHLALHGGVGQKPAHGPLPTGTA